MHAERKLVQILDDDVPGRLPLIEVAPEVARRNKWERCARSDAMNVDPVYGLARARAGPCGRKQRYLVPRAASRPNPS